jgi:hypothetical protein
MKIGSLLTVSVRLAPVLVVAAALCMLSVGSQGTPRARAGGGPVLALDLDLTGGACGSIDASATVVQGTDVLVAVCLTGNPGGIPLSGFG